MFIMLDLGLPEVLTSKVIMENPAKFRRRSVCANSSLRVVGYPNKEVLSSAGRGVVAVYRDGLIEGVLIDPIGTEYDQLGKAVVVRDNFIVASATGANNTKDANNGKVLVWRYLNDEWALTDEISPPIVNKLGGYGDSLACSADGQYIIVGVPIAVMGVLAYQGYASILQYNGLGYESVAIMTTALPTSHGRYGSIVGISDNGNFAICGWVQDTPAIIPDCLDIYVMTDGWELRQTTSIRDITPPAATGVNASFDNDDIIIEFTSHCGDVVVSEHIYGLVDNTIWALLSM
ncbi:MAG: hypothetical protein Q9M19_01065 [Mariprofundaceae bacterium]|nr:hypothetical protein [Mariprofundaceae bacterium]